MQPTAYRSHRNTAAATAAQACNEPRGIAVVLTCGMFAVACLAAQACDKPVDTFVLVSGLLTLWIFGVLELTKHVLRLCYQDHAKYDLVLRLVRAVLCETSLQSSHSTLEYP